MIKRLLSLFKSNKKEEEDIKIDFEIEDLKKGYFLDYDFKTWQINELAVYKWDNGVSDYESTIFDGKVKLYLTYETSTQKCSLYWDKKIDLVWPEARNLIRNKTDISTHTFIFNGQKYIFSCEGAALVKSSKESYGMVNWLFESEDGERLVSFNKYDDGFIESYIGKKISEHEISNITPGK